MKACFWRDLKRVEQDCDSASGPYIQRATFAIVADDVAIDYETAMAEYYSGTTQVKVYTRTGDAWAATDNLTATYLNGLFDVRGDYALLRAYRSTPNIDGGVYVFKRTAPGIWTEHQLLWAANPLAINVACYGAAMSPDNQWMMMQRDDFFLAGSDPGQVEVYELVAGSYVYHSTFEDTSGDVNAKSFGRRLSISNNGYVIVGHESESIISGGSNRGVAHIFKLTGGVWGWSQTLTKATYVSSDRYGQTVDITADGTKVVIGDSRGNTEIWDGGPAVFVRDAVKSGDYGTSYLGAASDDGLTMIRVTGAFSGESPLDIFELSDPGWEQTQTIVPDHTDAVGNDIQIVPADAEDGQIIVCSGPYAGEGTIWDEVFIYSR